MGRHFYIFSFRTMIKSQREKVKRKFRELGIDSITIEKFISYHLKNPLVYEVFLEEAIDERRFSDRLSANDIGCKIRAKKIKVSQEMLTYYSRALVALQPSFKKYFNFKETRGLKL